MNWILPMTVSKGNSTISTNLQKDSQQGHKLQTQASPEESLYLETHFIQEKNQCLLTDLISANKWIWKRYKNKEVALDQLIRPLCSKMQKDKRVQSSLILLRNYKLPEIPSRYKIKWFNSSTIGCSGERRLIEVW